MEKVNSNNDADLFLLVRHIKFIMKEKNENKRKFKTTDKNLESITRY